MEPRLRASRGPVWLTFSDARGSSGGLIPGIKADRLGNRGHLITTVTSSNACTTWRKDGAVEETVNAYWLKYSGVKSGEIKRSRRGVIDDLATEIMLLASYFKHPSFVEEQEHRIIIILEYAPDHSALKFREGRFSIIPDLELAASRALISKIVIGPTAHQLLARRSLEAFIENVYGIPLYIPGLPLIELSKTPYRPF